MSDPLDPYPPPRSKQNEPDEYVWKITVHERERILSSMKKDEGMLARTAREVAMRAPHDEVMKLVRHAQELSELRQRLEKITPTTRAR